jgi:long-chain acyl-CoA synthetase
MSRSPGSFVDALRAHAAERPAAVAIRDGGVSTTYRQLVGRVDERAAELTRAGLRRYDRVAIVADNSADHLVSAFAVWEAGGVLVTVYPSSGRSELTYCLSSSAPAAVLAASRLVDDVKAVSGPDVPVLDLHERLPEGLRLRRVDSPEPTPDDLALICYTSGTTSLPKAVMHRHSGLLRAAAAFGRVWHVGPEDRTIVCLPMAWAFGLVTTSMATLLAGGTVLPHARTKPELIVKAIVEDGATFMAGVTTIYAKIVEHLRELTPIPDLRTLRLCISGGEPRNESVFGEWAALTSCPVHDNFAASECFPVITYDPIEDPAPVPGSAGKVIDGAAMRLIDPATGRDVPPGARGEALWRGPALFIGYWGDPEATARALTDDGWYRTNDLVRVDEQGYVFVEGRLSDMIIRGGSNVSPSEVEGVLRGHPDVQDVAVVGVPDATYGQAVVAVVVATSGGQFDGSAVTAWCRAQLAGYKVPSVFLTVDALPLNPSTGKVDRRKVTAQLTSTR